MTKASKQDFDITILVAKNNLEKLIKYEGIHIEETLPDRNYDGLLSGQW